MIRYFHLLPPLALLLLLGGCQYFTFFKTNTTSAPAGLQSSPEVVCQAMGANYGYSSMDWCVRREELARGHNEFGF